MATISRFPEHCFCRPLHGVRLLPDDFEHYEFTGDFESELPLGECEAQAVFDADPVWSRVDKGDRYSSLLQLYRLPKQLQLAIDCEGKGAFSYEADGVTVSWQAGGTGPAHYFQTIGLGVWLEHRGVPCIHGNALAAGDVAIGLVAPSRTGKSTLTAALLKQGMQLMTDDMMAVYTRATSKKGLACPRVYPGWPMMRLWPDSAKRSMGCDTEALAPVHERFAKRLVDVAENAPESFCSTSQPLSALYLLERRERSADIGSKDIVSLESVAPGEAIIQLLQNSILGDAYESMGLQASRLQLLSELVRKTPVMKLTYAAGFEYLPDVCQAIWRDVRVRAHPKGAC